MTGLKSLICAAGSDFCITNDVLPQLLGFYQLAKVKFAHFFPIPSLVTSSSWLETRHGESISTVKNWQILLLWLSLSPEELVVEQLSVRLCL